MANYTPDDYPAGRVDVDGDDLFLLLNAYRTHATEDTLFEAHQRYIDLMCMAEGEEIIFVKPTEKLSAITQPYDPEKDVLP